MDHGYGYQDSLVGGFNLPTIVVNILLIMVNINGCYIWLMMVNNKMVGGIPTPLKKDGVRQLG
jgi:hypothetical protein